MSYLFKTRISIYPHLRLGFPSVGFPFKFFLLPMNVSLPSIVPHA